MKRKTNWSELDTPIQHQGKAITLPEDPSKMAIPDAIEALERKWEDEQRKYNVCEWIDEGHPHDALVAFVKAARNLFGFVSFEDTPSFWGPQPPRIMTVTTGLNSKVQCPFGDMKLPGVEEVVSVGIAPKRREEPPQLVIHGTLKNCEKGIILALAEETRRILKTESIYKGKAVSVSVDEFGNLAIENPPQFMDVSDVSESSVLFDSELEQQIRTNILTPIKHTQAVVKAGIPLGRGILLEGPFGTGKSLTARVVANVCEQNGWTFVLLDKVQGLKEALAFAARYSPAVVFAEDIDRMLWKRDERANDLINTISGVGSNLRDKVMIVLTTNYVERIDPVILRPGRLDAVISLRAPNANTVERLIRHYAGDLISADTDLTDASVELSGQIPAVVRECLERAKLSMIDRGGETVNGEDIVVATKTMKMHLALLAKKPETSSLGERLGRDLQDLIVNELDNRICDIMLPVYDYVGGDKESLRHH